MRPSASPRPRGLDERDRAGDDRPRRRRRGRSTARAAPARRAPPPRRPPRAASRREPRRPARPPRRASPKRCEVASVETTTPLDPRARGLDDVREDRADLDARELVGVADEDDPRVGSRAPQRLGEERERDHRRLVDDDDVRVEPLARAARSRRGRRRAAACSVVARGDASLGPAPCAAALPSRTAWSRRDAAFPVGAASATDSGRAHVGGDGQEQGDRGGLARAGAARDDGDRGCECASHGQRAAPRRRWRRGRRAPPRRRRGGRAGARRGAGRRRAARAARSDAGSSVGR